VLARTRAAAVRWAELIRESDSLRLAMDPALDIVTFYPVVDGEQRVSAISAETQRVFAALMNDAEQPIYLATLKVSRPLLGGDASLVWDQDEALVFRSVLMKPEHFEAVPELHRRVAEELGFRS
jgi:hypothetical protein